MVCSAKTLDYRQAYRYTAGMKKGSHHTAETREKIRASNMGKKHTAETRAKLSAYHMGKKHSQETRAKMSAAKIGKPLSLQHKANISSGQKGRKHSAKAKAKMSAAKMGNVVSEETKAKLSAVNRGKKHSIETKERMSAAHKGKKFSAETRANMSAAQKGKPKSAEVIQKGRGTWAKNGNISKGQKTLYRILLSMGIPFIPEQYFRLSGRCAFVDAFLPIQNMAIEYDGHQSHRTPGGKAKDKLRDAQMRNLHGVQTLRIGNKEVFTDHALTKIADALTTTKAESVQSNGIDFPSQNCQGLRQGEAEQPLQMVEVGRVLARI